MIYGVTNDDDLVGLEALEFAEEIENFSFKTVVASDESTHPRKGYVTNHMENAPINDGDVDVYLCGPPPIVDAVLGYFREQGICQLSSTTKFTPSVSAVEKWHDPAFHRQGDGGPGAAQGIGRRVAELAAAEGARLVLVDIADYVQGVAAELRDQGSEALAVQANLETWEGAEMVMAKAHEQYGRIDILVNNVGGTIWAQPFEHYQPEQIQKEIQRSLFPTLWCCRAVLPYMVEQKGGAIVNVSSVATRGLMRVP